MGAGLPYFYMLSNVFCTNEKFGRERNKQKQGVVIPFVCTIYII